MKPATLLLPPPPKDVPGIIMDMLPLVAPGADSDGIHQSVMLVQKLVVLCEQAKANGTTEKIVAAMFQSLLKNDMDIVSTLNKIRKYPSIERAANDSGAINKKAGEPAS